MSHTITPSGRSVNPWWIGITVTIATFMELLDTSIANVSLPHIAGGLGTESGRFRGVIRFKTVGLRLNKLFACLNLRYRPLRFINFA